MAQNGRFHVDETLSQSCLDILQTCPPSCRSADEVEILKQVLDRFRFFQQFSPRIRYELSQRIRLSTKDVGEIAVREGSIPCNFYVVFQGKLSVFKQNNNLQSLGTGILDDTTFNLQRKYGKYICSLGSGDSFGEKGLLLQAQAADGHGDRGVRRAATVVAMEACTLLEVSADDFVRFLSHGVMWSPEHCRDVLGTEPDFRSVEDIRHLMAFIKPVRFFQQLSPDVCANLCRSMSYSFVSRGSLVCRQGDVGDSFHVILSGSVAVHVKALAEFATATATDTTAAGAAAAITPIKAVQEEGQEENSDAAAAGGDGDGKSERDSRYAARFTDVYGPPVLTLVHGDAFGERALLTAGGRRQATIVATGGDVELISISRREYSRLLSSSHGNTVYDLASARAALRKEPLQRSAQDLLFLRELVGTLPFFKQLPRALQRRLCQVIRLQTAEPQTPVFFQDEPPRHFYIILSGSVSAHVDHSSAEQRTMRKAHDTWMRLNRDLASDPSSPAALRSLLQRIGTCVATLHSGDAFGEMSLMEHRPRSSTVMTREACEFMVLSRDEYDSIARFDVVYDPTHCLAVLARPPEQRSREDITHLSLFCEHLDFFRPLPESLTQRLCGVMHYGKVGAYQPVVLQGEQHSGALFILLSGSVSVHRHSGRGSAPLSQSAILSITGGKPHSVKDRPRWHHGLNPAALAQHSGAVRATQRIKKDAAGAASAPDDTGAAGDDGEAGSGSGGGNGSGGTQTAAASHHHHHHPPPARPVSPSIAVHRNHFSALNKDGGVRYDHASGQLRATPPPGATQGGTPKRGAGADAAGSSDSSSSVETVGKRLEFGTSATGAQTGEGVPTTGAAEAGGDSGGGSHRMFDALDPHMFLLDLPCRPVAPEHRHHLAEVFGRCQAVLVGGDTFGDLSPPAEVHYADPAAAAAAAAAADDGGGGGGGGIGGAFALSAASGADVVHHHARGSSIISRTETEFLIVDRAFFHAHFSLQPALLQPQLCRHVLSLPARERSRKDIDMLLSLARTIDFFHTLSESVVRQLCVAMTLKHAPAGQRLFRQGQPGDCFYIILSGTLEMRVATDREEAANQDAQHFHSKLQARQQRRRRRATLAAEAAAAEAAAADAASKPQPPAVGVGKGGLRLDVSAALGFNNASPSHASPRSRAQRSTPRSRGSGKRSGSPLGGSPLGSGLAADERSESEDELGSGGSDSDSEGDREEGSGGGGVGAGGRGKGKKCVCLGLEESAASNQYGTCVGILSCGDGVGELSLMHGGQRQSTVTLLEDCELLCLSKADYDSILAELCDTIDFQSHAHKARVVRARGRSLRGEVELFRHITKPLPSFQAMTEAQRARLFTALDVHHYEAGRVIYAPGEAAEDMFIVLEGSVTLADGGHFGTGNLHPVRTVTPDQTFGALDLLLGSPRALTATATSSSFCLKLDRKGYAHLWRGRHDGQYTDMVAFLRQLKPFSQLGRREFATVVNSASLKRVPRQSVLRHVGHNLHFIMTGEAKLWREHRCVCVLGAGQLYSGGLLQARGTARSRGAHAPSNLLLDGKPSAAAAAAAAAAASRAAAASEAAAMDSAQWMYRMGLADKPMSASSSSSVAGGGGTGGGTSVRVSGRLRSQLPWKGHRPGGGGSDGPARAARARTAPDGSRGGHQSRAAEAAAGGKGGEAAKDWGELVVTQNTTFLLISRDVIAKRYIGGPAVRYLLHTARQHAAWLSDRNRTLATISRTVSHLFGHGDAAASALRKTRERRDRRRRTAAAAAAAGQSNGDEPSGGPNAAQPGSHWAQGGAAAAEAEAAVAMPPPSLSTSLFPVPLPPPSRSPRALPLSSEGGRGGSLNARAPPPTGPPPPYPPHSGGGGSMGGSGSGSGGGRTLDLQALTAALHYGTQVGPPTRPAAAAAAAATLAAASTAAAGAAADGAMHRARRRRHGGSGSGSGSGSARHHHVSTREDVARLSPSQKALLPLRLLSACPPPTALQASIARIMEPSLVVRPPSEVAAAAAAQPSPPSASPPPALAASAAALSLPGGGGSSGGAQRSRHKLLRARQQPFRPRPPPPRMPPPGSPGGAAAPSALTTLLNLSAAADAAAAAAAAAASTSSAAGARGRGSAKQSEISAALRPSIAQPSFPATHPLKHRRRSSAEEQQNAMLPAPPPPPRRAAGAAYSGQAQTSVNRLLDHIATANTKRRVMIGSPLVDRALYGGRLRRQRIRRIFGAPNQVPEDDSSGFATYRYSSLNY